MRKRNRGTLALSTEGVQIVRTAVYQKGWSQETWAFESNTSTSTIKRFLSGKAIDPSCFYSLLDKIGLKVDDFILKRNDSRKVSLTRLQESPLSSDSFGVFMTATFTEEKRSQIERGIRHLQQLLIDSEVIFSEHKGAVTVSGNFSEENREHIEMTIAQLEKLFISCRITW